jgi:hypothetical protein
VPPACAGVDDLQEEPVDRVDAAAHDRERRRGRRDRADDRRRIRREVDDPQRRPSATYARPFATTSELTDPGVSTVRTTAGAAGC